MNGQLLSLPPDAPLSIGVKLVTFCDTSRTAICHTLHIKAANIASIRALATDAVNSGETMEAMQQIELIASEVFQQLNSLALAVSQLQTTEPS